MTKTLPIIGAMILLGLAPSCATSKEETRQNEAALVTTSALVAALPMIPVALPFNVVRGIHERNAEKQLQNVLDPVYEKRITLIQQRDPVADARQAFSGGATAFMASTTRGSLFPGLEHTDFHLNRQFGLQNYARSQQSDLLQYLQKLMSKDPVHVQNKDVPYFTETYKRFIHVCWVYREAFNKEMYRHYMSSGKSLQTTGAPRAR